MEIRSYLETVIDQPPSCLEFCPLNPSCFVVGTYKLKADQTSDATTQKEAVQARSGSVELYQITFRRDDMSPRAFALSRGERVNLPEASVLDLHFHPQDCDLLAICTSSSQLVFFRIDRTSSGKLHFHEAGTYQMQTDATILATSFAWSNNDLTSTASRYSFAVLFSSGEVRLVFLRQEDVSKSRINDSTLLAQCSIEPAHSLEAWTVALHDQRDNRRIFLLTGGDDSVLTLNSFTEQNQGKIATTQLFRDRRSHAAGVTAILPITFQVENWGTSPPLIYLTGSYDEYLRCFMAQDNNAGIPLRAQLLSQIRLHGGVWRLKQVGETMHEVHAHDGESISTIIILACCMHVGVRIVQLSRRYHRDQPSSCLDEWQLQVVARFTQGHESMCYAADWVESKKVLTPLSCNEGVIGAESDNIGKKDENHSNSTAELLQQHVLSADADADAVVALWTDLLVASTSFYDRKISIWTFPLGRDDDDNDDENNDGHNCNDNSSGKNSIDTIERGDTV